MSAVATFQDGIAAARVGDRRAAVKIALQQVLFGMVPVIMLLALARAILESPGVGVDFSNAYWTAAHRLLSGGDPYYWTHAQLAGGVSFVYPALSAVVFVPFALLSRGTAADLFTLICIALAPLTLWVLNVRDWRTYGVALMWGPFFVAWQSGNETMLLVLMTALVWRYRDRPWAAAMLTAAAISLKPFIWPLALWLLATRRWRASVYTLIWGLALNFVAWSVVGFGEIRAYLHVAALDSDYTWRTGYSVTGVAAHLGLGHAAGEAIAVLISLTLIVAIVQMALIRGRERQALVLTVALMLVASPLVWSHYFVLLLIPIAIQRPRLSILWFLPMAMWVCPPSVHAHLWQEAVAWSVAGTMLVALTRHRPPDARF